jgi:hypothetical protein
MIYRGLGFLDWGSSQPPCFPPPFRQQLVFLSPSSCVSPVDLTEVTGEGEGLALYKITEYSLKVTTSSDT